MLNESWPHTLLSSCELPLLGCGQRPPPAHSRVLGLLHVWEAERRDRRFGRASRELDVPLTVACGMVMTAHPDSCTRALCAGAGIQVRRQTEQALECERYIRFAEPLPGAGVAVAR